MSAAPTKRQARRKATASKSLAAKPVPRPIPGPPVVRAVALQGAYADTIAVVPQTAASLVIVPGRHPEEEDGERKKVLVPFAELSLKGGAIEAISQLEGDEDQKLPELLRQNVPVENLAFILMDLMKDLRRICIELSEIDSRKLEVDRARMGMVRFYVAHLERHARQCRLRLDNTYGAPDSDGSQPGG